jgi:hypothetical protein
MTSQKNKSIAATQELAALRQEAVKRFGALCLWDINPTNDLSGLRIIASRLKKYGNMDAFHLAERIEQRLANAR